MHLTRPPPEKDTLSDMLDEDEHEEPPPRPKRGKMQHF